MGKKIVISESQYRRVFLNEQEIIKKPSVKEIQKFLNKKGLTDYEGNELKEDNGWGDKTASAFSKYHFGLDTKVETSKNLWTKLKLQGYEVGNSYKNINKLITEIVKIINYKESPTTGVQDFLKDLTDGGGIELKNYWDRFKKYASSGLNLSDELKDDMLFNKYIKSVEDGNKFRQWVRNSSDSIKKINDSFKILNITDGFSKTGPIDNINFLIAWDIAGGDYIKSEFNYQTDDLEKETLSQVKKDVGDFKFNKSGYKEFQNYKKAIANWSVISSSFNWDGPKDFKLNNETIANIGTISTSTCIDPSWLLEKVAYFGHQIKTYSALGEYGKNNQMRLDYKSSIYNTPLTDEEYESLQDLIDDFQNRGDLNEELNNDVVKSEKILSEQYDPNNIFDDISELNIDSILDYNELRNLINNEGDILYMLGDEEYTKNNFTTNSDPFNQRALWGPNDTRKREEDRQRVLADMGQKRRKSLFRLLSVIDDNLIEIIVVRNNYKEFLSYVDLVNKRIAEQKSNWVGWLDKKKKFVKFSDYNIPSYSIGTKLISAGNAVYTLKDYCKGDLGGLFFYFDPKDRRGVKNPFACCVKYQKGTVKKVPAVVMVKSNKKYNIDISVNIDDACYVQNVQPWGEWFDDKVDGCVEDWHCWADIASIVSSFFGPIGLIVAGVIDGISALGYVVEGDEGWRLNAGLTAIGIIPGLTETRRFIKGGSKNIKTLQKIGDAIKGLDGIEAQIKIEKIVSRLPDTQRKAIGEFLEKGVKEIGDNADEIKKLLPNSEEISKLDPWQKEILEREIKNMSPEKFADEFVNIHKSDLKKFINSKRVKDVIKPANILQISLFGGLYFGSDQIGKKLKDLHDNYKIDPFGLFDGEGNEEDTGDDKISKSLEVIANDVALQTKVESELGLDFSGFEGGKVLEERIDKLTNLSSEINKITVNLKNDLEENDNRTTLINVIILYLYTEVNSQKGISDEVLDTNKKVLDFFKSLKKPINEKDLTDFIKELKNEKISPKTKNQLQLEIIEPNKNYSASEADNMFISIEELIEETEEEFDSIKEEINRIKSLFNNERIYGNLIKD
jgi:hypothetical protein